MITKSWDPGNEKDLILSPKDAHLDKTQSRSVSVIDMNHSKLKI